MKYLIQLIISIITAGIVHEAGHYLVALLYGHRLKFRFSLGKLFSISVPRWVWYMPDDTPKHQRNIALAGFGLELISAMVVYIIYPIYAVVVVIHLLAYRFYAGEDSDLKWV